MTRTRLLQLAAAASFLTIVGAFFFQYVVGVQPCHLCILQRYPHWAMGVVGLLALWLGWRLLAILGTLIAVYSTGLAIYHSGVERKLWDGPSDCTGGAGNLSGLSGTDLLSTDFESNLVMCDEISFTILGLSFANINVMLSAGLIVVWAMAALRK